MQLKKYILILFLSLAFNFLSAQVITFYVVTVNGSYVVKDPLQLSYNIEEVPVKYRFSSPAIAQNWIDAHKQEYPTATWGVKTINLGS